MNIIFLTLTSIKSLYDSNIYTDLLLEFVKNQHNVYVVCPTKRKNKRGTHVIDEGICKILEVKTGNIEQTNIVEKGISTVLIENQYRKAIIKHFNKVHFDLILYSTPPITLVKVVEYLKKRDNAKTYLMLKDIFPQNAVDLCMISKKGIKVLVYTFFRNKEKNLYKQSDYIGCMSKANVDYLLRNNPELRAQAVEICPNSIALRTIEKDETKMNEIRKKYNIPFGITVFLYGGNLGKPQGIDFLIDCLRANSNNEHAYFVIAGSGTEFHKLKSYFENENSANAQLFELLPKEDYDILANSCDVGLIFLDRRFTIPNFPSRLLSYMQASIPVLAATDASTDLGKVIEDGYFGFWCESNDVLEFCKHVNLLCDADLRKKMGTNARKYLENNFTTEKSYEIIMSHFK